jgi:DNA-binding FadR family transcriptional regulator
LREALRMLQEEGLIEAEPNRLNTQALVRYYEREWREVNR